MMILSVEKANAAVVVVTLLQVICSGSGTSLDTTNDGSHDNTWRNSQDRLPHVRVKRSQTDEESVHTPKAKPVGESTLINSLLDDFDHNLRPNNDGPPVIVGCGFHLLSLSSISEITMDYKIDIFLRQVWEDFRLTYTPRANREPLLIPYTLYGQVWRPPIFFPNEKKSEFHTVPLPSVSYKLYPNGTVFYSARVTLTVSCPMDLASFPMDRQECFLKIASYSMPTSDLTLEWLAPSITFDDELELPQFELLNTSTTHCTTKYTTGSFDCIKATFLFRRQYGYFVLQTYIPTILIVILSWVSFWISVEAVPARISLGVTTVLTMATQLSGSKEALPKVSYPKAIDIWMSTCMTFVFAALLEYALVNALSQRGRTARQNGNTYMLSKSDHGTGSGNDDVIPMETIKPLDSDRKVKVTYGKVLTTEPTHQGASSLQLYEKLRKLTTQIDKLSRILFPVVFIVFNIIYWAVFLG